MTSFSEVRRKSIDGLIVTSHDFQNIAKHVFSEYDDSQQSFHGHADFSIELEREDGVRLKGASLSLLNEGATILEKRIIRAAIYFRDFSSGRKISISLNHEGFAYTSRSYLEVEGKDRSWVNGQLAILDGIISGIQTQSHIVKRYKWFFAIFLGIPIGYPYLDLLGLYTYFDSFIGGNENEPILSENGDNHSQRLLIAMLSLLIGFLPAYVIMGTIQSALWPSIEIQIGPPHRFKEKRRRTVAAWLISLIIIPVLLAVFLRIFLG